jgi:hypothetical protein
MASYIEGLQQTGLVQSLRWQDFIAIVNAKALSLDYITSTDTYTIYAQDGLTVYATSLVFANASSYPFPFPDGYTLAQNNTDLSSFTTTYQATANAGTHFATGTTGATAPLAGILVGGTDPGGLLQAAGVTDPSTAAVASQRALVVAISPNTPISVSSTLLADRTATGTIAALNANVQMSAQGVGDVGVTITGTWVATLTFQGTIDGTNWFTIDAMPLPVTSSSVCAQTTTANGQWTIAAAGLAKVRVIATAYTSGTATVTMEGNQASSTIEGIITVQQATAANLQATATQGTPNTLANAWPVEMTDGTNVLGTSAHPVRVDPTGTTTQPVSGTVTANQGTSPWVVSLTSTTITGTVAVTQSTSPWIVAGGGTAGTPATGVVTIQGISGGTAVPISGSVTVTGTVAVTQSTSPWVVQDSADGAVANGAAGTKSMLGGLIYLASAPTITTGNQNSLLGDIHGNLLVNLQTPLPAGSNVIGAVTQSGGPWTVVTGDSTLATYVASTKLLSVASVPTDILTIVGSATKKVRITRIIISGQQSGGSNVFFQVIKRSALDTGGTSATVTAVPYDSGDAAATAVVKAYTANPTGLGTAVGNVAGLNLLIPGNTTQSNQPFVMEWGTPQNTKALVLNNATENLAINLNGVTMGGSALDITVEWTEE